VRGWRGVLGVVCVGVGLLTSGCESIHKVRQERFLMNTLFQVVIYARDQRAARQWAERALDIARDLEDRYSIHRTNAFLFDLNEKGEGVLDDDLFVVWQDVETLFHLSGGLFDPTVEPLMRLWGFYGDGERHVPPRDRILLTLSSVGFQAVEREGRRVVLHGRRVDLGGVLKGYALDRMAAYLKTQPLTGFLLNAGGNILVWGSKPDHTPWQLAIRHPRQVSEVIALFSLKEGSVATSGDYEQYFIEKGVRYHHILHPGTGYPVSNGAISVTVVAPTGIESDGMSTVMFLLGREKGIALADRLGIGVCYVMSDLSLATNRFFPGFSGTP